jgi:hypothetical protein
MAKPTTKKKLPPVVSWDMDFGFDSYLVRVKARTKREARKKAIAKLKRTPVTKFISKHTTFLDKSY